MLAATIVPGRPGDSRLDELAESGDGSIVVDGLLVGVCATDREIIRDGFGGLPPGRDRMIGFHESLGRVRSAPQGSGFAAGDLIAGIVRYPCAEPTCRPCRAGEWDYCASGDYTERGITRRDGFGAQRWRTDPAYAVRLDPSLARAGVLAEPMSVVAKAWRQVDAVHARSAVAPRTVAVIGAGPIGLLAAMVGVRRGLDVHVTDVVADGPKPDLVRDLGATYHAEPIEQAGVRADVVLEAAGSAETTWRAVQATARNSVTCLIGLSERRTDFRPDPQQLFGPMIGGNRAVLGTVNAGRPDWQVAAAELARADVGWLERLLTRVVPLRSWPDALTPHPGDVKVVVDLTDA
ncbi:MAG: alcohol dehydrogenase catalytic domain-containing protein [Mycobacteriales bacterium]